MDFASRADVAEHATFSFDVYIFATKACNIFFSEIDLTYFGEICQD